MANNKNKQLNIACRQHVDGKYVGFVLDLPQIICQANSMDQLNQRILAAVNKYAIYLQNKKEIVAKSF